MEKSENQFDQEIKSLLDSHQPDVLPQWDHMQSQLDAAYEDELFDEKIRKVVHNAQVYNDQMSWEAFDQKLKMQADRKKKIINTRIIESTLFFLFLWTLHNIGVGHFIQDQIQVHQQPMAVQDNNTRQERTTAANATLSHNAYGLIPTPETTEYRPGSETSPAYHENKIVTSESFGFLESKVTTSEKNGLSSDEPLSKTALSSSGNSPLSERFPEQDFTKFSNLAPEQANSNITKFLWPLHSTLRIPEEIELPLVANGIANQAKAISEFGELPKPINPFHINYAKSIGLFAGSMVNIIQSPSFIQPEVNYTQAKLAHQAGLKFDFHQGDWTIRTGIAYQHIKYQPNFSETMGSFEGGYFKIHFRELEAHLVNLPVALSKTIIANENWDLSVHMGLSLTASLKNNYRLDTVTDLSSNNVQNINFNPTSASEIISRVRNESNKGLLEGGNIGTNSYASLIGGVRYQRKINPALSYFGELEVSKMLGQIGFGPNNDKFIIIGLNTGLSFRFGGH